jgi:16S rRNA (cytosine1402-N4)-methyltransferase
MDDKQPNDKPNRRVRYKGTHPKKFGEKYKELIPEKYADDVAKIIEQGKTPAGMHRSICVQEILQIINAQPGNIGLDATLGFGGHSEAILQKILPTGKLWATDVDAIELPKTKARLNSLGYSDDVLEIRKMNFSQIDLLVYEAGLFDFAIADLGVSSMQIDNPSRGFSFKIDAPLDLRLNPNSGKPASDFLKSISQKELAEIFIDNADEPHAHEISKQITTAINNELEINTTFQLRDTISAAIKPFAKNEAEDFVKKTCQRCFQAIRIAINNEFVVLDKFLEKLPGVLKPGAKVAILSFHSGEDRRVKKSFQQFYHEGIYKDIAQEIIRPTVEECASNPRAKSAKLRWAQKA